MGATTTDLPNGDHVVFLDPTQVKERDRRTIKQGFMRLSESTVNNLQEAVDKEQEVTPSMFAKADFAILDELNDAAIVAFVQHWKRPDPSNLDGPDTDVMPTVEALLDLDGPSYDKMAEVAAPLIEAMTLTFEPTKPGTDSPTPPASV